MLLHNNCYVTQDVLNAINCLPVNQYKTRTKIGKVRKFIIYTGSDLAINDRKNQVTRPATSVERRNSLSKTQEFYLLAMKTVEYT